MSKLCALVVSLFAILVLSAPPALAQTQAWPQQPVRFILPFGPGAGADIGARLIQDRLQARWGKPVVIENRPGGDSMIAIQAVLAANDDHTFLWGPSGSFIVHPYQYKKLPYEPADLLPVARFSSTILGVGAPASMKVATLADFVKRARAEPGKFNSAAVPGITELAFDYFAHNAKITTTKVPYKDIVQAVNDLAEDRLQVYSASYAILRPQREAGRITVLAQMGRERAPSLRYIPTGIEAGFPELEMDGKDTGVVELPVEWIRDDAVYFNMNRFAALRPYTPPAGVFDIFKREFDAAYREGGIFQLTMHPHVIGYRSRIWILQELIAYIQGHEKVWFATHADIARYAKANS